MKNTIVGMVGSELVSELERHLREYQEMDLNSDDIMDRIKGFNSLTVMCMYLLAIEDGYKDLSYRIKRAFECLNIKQEEDFRKLVEINEEDKLLSKLDKIDLINLANRLDLYSLSQNEYYKLDETHRKYYDVLDSYINKKSN